MSSRAAARHGPAGQRRARQGAEGNFGPFVHLGLLLAALLVGCAADAVGNPVALVREARYLKRGVPAQFDVDPSFTPAERAEIEQAIAERAREDIIIEVVPAGDGHFIRGLPDFGDTSAGGGFYSNDRLSIWIDSANLPPGRTRTVAYAQIGGLAQKP